MKKRILSVLILCALTLALAGCGGKTESPAPTSESTESAETPTTQESEDAAAADEKQEQTEAATIATAESTAEIAEEEPPREIKNITKYKSFGNGTLFFEIDNTGYVYDILENKMYDYDTKELKDIYYACGKLVADGDTTITNLETMKAYEGKRLLIDDPNYQLMAYNAVYSVKEDFDGNVYSFGILGSNGEWVLPMSSEYAVCDLLKSSLNSLTVNKVTSSFVIFNTRSGAKYCYDYKTNEMLERGNSCYWAFDNYLLLATSIDAGRNFYSVYNTKTKETTKLDGEFSFYCIAREHCIELNGTDNRFTIIGSSGNILNYDLSGYNINVGDILDATEDYIVFAAKNTDGDTYTIILDKNGNRVVDPIEATSSTFPSIYGDYVIYTSSNYIVNCKTGEMKTYSDDSLRLEEIDLTSGKLLMKSDGAYYLADLADPETLINPFEQ